jgi:hypothetical protein
MCLRRAPEKYIAGAKAPAGAALDRAAIDSRLSTPPPVSPVLKWVTQFKFRFRQRNESGITRAVKSQLCLIIIQIIQLTHPQLSVLKRGLESCQPADYLSLSNKELDNKGTGRQHTMKMYEGLEAWINHS